MYVSRSTVERVRNAFVEVSSEPAFDGESEARLIALACSSPRQGPTRWTLRLLADRLVEL